MNQEFVTIVNSKIQNYVTITNLMGETDLSTYKLKKNMSSTETELDTEVNSYQLTLTTSTKKVTSFNLPTKRSYDFNKFAYASMFSQPTNTSLHENKDQIKKTTSGSINEHHPSLTSTTNVSSYSNSLNDDNASIAYTDDEKLMSNNQLALFDGQMARSFPEFQQQS